MFEVTCPCSINVLSDYIAEVAGLPLELDSSEREALGREVLDFLGQWLERRGQVPASWPEPDDRLIEALPRGLSEDGVPARVSPLLFRVSAIAAYTSLSTRARSFSPVAS